MADPKTTQALEEWLIIATFVIAISLPAVLTKYKTDSMPSFDENRRLAGFPELSMSLSKLARFPGGFGLYFNDHFAFRRTLVRSQAVVRVKWLGDSTSPNVIVGGDGWLFNRTNIGVRANDEPLTLVQVARWRQALIDRSSWLAARGIKYCFVVAPAKQEIYPDTYPRPWP
jgi:alginate O-acetyltransferase complex protein AlgJ